MFKKKTAALIAAGLLAVLPALAGAALDGKSFHGKLKEVGKKDGNGDTFEFKDGQFRSTACEREGFHYGAYTVEGSGENYTFTAKVTNKKGETMDWRGTVTGDTVTGTATFTSEGKPPTGFTFEGMAHEQAKK
jgi:hypothetical protein